MAYIRMTWRFPVTCVAALAFVIFLSDVSVSEAGSCCGGSSMSSSSGSSSSSSQVNSGGSFASTVATQTVSDFIVKLLVMGVKNVKSFFNTVTRKWETRHYGPIADKWFDQLEHELIADGTRNTVALKRARGMFKSEVYFYARSMLRNPKDNYPALLERSLHGLQKELGKDDIGVKLAEVIASGSWKTWKTEESSESDD